MNVVCKKTTDITEKECKQILNLFNEVFDRNSSVVEMRNNYVCNPYGESYHALLYDDGILIGHNAGMPGVYMVNGKKCKAVNNVGLMISKKNRGLVGFMSLLKESYMFYKREGVHFIYSMPNDNSYPILTKLKYMRDISPLNIYCIPNRIGGLKPKFTCLNFLSRLFCKTYCSVCDLFATETIVEFSVHKDLESFNKKRYRRSDGDYNIIEYKGSRFVYKVQQFQGIKTAFLIDVFEKSEKNFCKAVRYIQEKDSEKFDILLYVGSLPFSNSGLIKLPKRMEPKSFRLVGHILDREYLGNSKNDIFDINKWDINLSDDDVI